MDTRLTEFGETLIFINVIIVHGVKLITSFA